MSEQVRERIIGIAVLIIMMVGVIPWLLTHMASSASSAKSSVASTQPSPVAQAHSTSSSRVVASTSTPVVSADHSLHLQQQSKPVPPQQLVKQQRAGWYAQIASFQASSHAQAQQQQLEQQHVSSRIERVALAGKKTYRVYLGPYPSRAKLQQLTKRFFRDRPPIVTYMKE